MNLYSVLKSNNINISFIELKYGVTRYEIINELIHVKEYRRILIGLSMEINLALNYKSTYARLETIKKLGFVALNRPYLKNKDCVKIENFYINNPELLEIKIKNAFIDIVGLLKDLE